jgi:hypothetical protein
MTHVQRRANRFEFRYRSPDDLAGKPVPARFPEALGALINPGTQRFKREIVRALKTNDPQTANRRVLSHIADAHALIDEARRFLVEGPRLGISPDQIRSLIEEYEHRLLAVDDETRRTGFGIRPKGTENAPGMSDDEFAGFSRMVDFVDEETKAAVARMRPHVMATDAVEDALDRRGSFSPRVTRLGPSSNLAS